LGRIVNCQTLALLTLARGEAPVMAGLRLSLLESRTGDQARLERAGGPAERRSARAKSEIALAELDRLISAGVRFGGVLADAGHGMSAPFRQVLSARSLAWAVGIPVTRRSTDATSNSSSPSPDAVAPRAAHANALSVGAEDVLANANWRMLTWPRERKGR
jgi:SRSO17 transposase